MAVRGSVPQRNGRRVSLTRSGGASVPGKNVRREPKKVAAPKAARSGLPGQGLFNRSRLERVRSFFSTTLFLSIVVFFVAAVGVGLIYVYSSLTSGDYFALKTLEIQGNSRLSSREILETADLADGGNTLALSISVVEESLSRHSWVEEVSVKRVLPGTLIISVREKTPAFWVLHEGTLYYADDRGRLIAPVVAGKFASLPTLEVEPGAEDTAAVLPDLVKSLQESRLPLNMGNVSVVRLSAARGLELYVDDTHLKISIGLEEWTSNLRRLGRTLADLARRNELKDVREIRAQGANVWVERRTGFTDVLRAV
jgi:cell division protein FtsQ